MFSAFLICYFTSAFLFFVCLPNNCDDGCKFSLQQSLLTLNCV